MSVLYNNLNQQNLVFTAVVQFFQVRFLYTFGSQGKGHEYIWKPVSDADISKWGSRKGNGWAVSSSLVLRGRAGQGVAGGGGRMLIPREVSNRCEGTQSQDARWELRLLRRAGHSSLCFGGDKAVRNCIRTELSSVGNRKCFVPFGECPIFHSGPIFVPQPWLCDLPSMGAYVLARKVSLAKCYGLEWSGARMENRVNSIKAQGPRLWTSHSLDFMRGWKVNYLLSLNEVDFENPFPKRVVFTSAFLWKIKAGWTRVTRELGLPNFGV